MKISRSLGLVKHLFNPKPPESGRNTPFNVSIPGKGQRENHRLVFVDINQFHAGVHGDDIRGNVLGIKQLAFLDFRFELLYIVSIPIAEFSGRGNQILKPFEVEPGNVNGAVLHN